LGQHGSAAVEVKASPWPLVAAVVLGSAAALFTLVVTMSAAALSATPSAGVEAGLHGVSDLARTEIPQRYLVLYQQAARRYGLDWSILAGIGEVECDHGRDPDPSCTQEGVLNGAGAGGPAQFLSSTWREYGVDGDGDGVKDRWDPADAIASMANYLHASGAPGDYRAAIYAYNHAAWYVEAVEHWAALYRGSSQSQSALGGSLDISAAAAPGAPVRLIAGDRAVLSPGNGHLALIPAQAPSVVQALVIAGNELQELPYGPAGHPDPRGALNEDCSSALNYMLYRAGIRPIAEILKDNPLAQSYVRWGLPGPGRWVSIYATSSPSAHVFIVVAGLRLDTSHHGTDTGPNRAQDGPRWRILNQIPTWAHWSVRHPPGL
jgi:Transglycosylase SLT domain